MIDCKGCLEIMNLSVEDMEKVLNNELTLIQSHSSDCGMIEYLNKMKAENKILPDIFNYNLQHRIYKKQFEAL